MAKDDIYELTVRQTVALQNVVNVHHFLQSRVDGSGLAVDALNTLWNSIFKLAFKALLSSELNIVDISIRRIKPTQTQPTVFAVGENGTNMVNAMPTHCCALVRQFAEPAVRKGTGSVKIAGVPQDAVNQGRVSVAYAALMNTYGNKFVGEIIDATSTYAFEPSVFSQIDSVARPIIRAGHSSRVRTVHSRQIGQGA